MSWQERRRYGRQFYREFPLLELGASLADEPASVGAYARHHLRPENAPAPGRGTRVPTSPPDRIFRCPTTGRRFGFAANHRTYMRELHPPAVDFRRFASPHDGWRFAFKDNLKLHHDVLAFERRQANDVERRLQWKHRPEFAVPIASPCDRPYKKRVAISIDLPTTTKEWGYHPQWPADADDLPALPEADRTDDGRHRGWTHSDRADNWFLEEQKLATAHDAYADFYESRLGGRGATVPKLWTRVFPADADCGNCDGEKMETDNRAE